jgi:hypothetical protein
VAPEKAAIRALEKQLGRKATTDELATLMTSGSFVRMGTTPSRQTAPSSVPTGTPFATATTGGANRAFGGADFYSIDLKQILSHTFERDFAVDRKNHLLGEMLKRDYAMEVEESAAGKLVLRGTDDAAPPTVVVNTPNGPREVELELIEVLGNPMLLHNRFGVHIGDLPPAGRIAGTAERAIEGGAAAPAQIGGPRLLEPPTLDLALRQGEAVVPRRDLIGPQRPGAGAPDPQRALPPPATGGALTNVEFRAGEGFSDFLAGAVQSEPVLGKFLVPKPVAEAFRTVTTSNRGRSDSIIDQLGGTLGFTAYERFMNLNTQLLLSSPVELAAHFSRIVSTLVSFPGVGDDLGKMAQTANRLIPFVGPRITGVISMFKTYNTAADLALEGRIAEAVGLPTRAFQSDRVQGFFAKFGEAGKKFEELTEIGRTILFDLPVTAINEPGLRRSLLDRVKGVDMRARMVAVKALETKLGRQANTEEIAQHLMRFGAYNEALQTNIVTNLRRLKLNPFAAGQQGFIRGEVQKLYGNLGLPKSTLEELGAETVRAMRAEMLYRGVGGTAIAMMTMNFALSGKWPWENQTNHRLDIDTGFRDQNGRPWYIKFTSVAPDIARSTRITGLRMIAEMAGADATAAGVGVDALRQIRNDAITYGFSSPGIQAGSALLTGNSLFAVEDLGGGAQPLSLIPPQPTDSQVLKERFFMTAGAANPTVEMFLGIGEHEGKPIASKILSQANFKLTLGREPVAEFTSETRTQRARVFEVVQDRVGRAWKKYPDPTQRGQRLRMYLEEVRAFPPEQRQMALENMMRSDGIRMRGQATSLGRTVVGEPFR